MQRVFLSLAALKILFFVFSFQHFDYKVHGYGFLIFFLLGVHWTWIHGLLFIKLVKFLSIVSSNIFPAPFSLTCFWNSSYMNTRLLTVPPMFLMLCSDLSIFLSLYLSLVFSINFPFSSQISFSVMSNLALSLSKWS